MTNPRHTLRFLAIHESFMAATVCSVHVLTRIFVAVALALGALAIWACYLPARRAIRVPAMTALRHE